MGGVNYSKILPPKSYIDVNDFESVEKLAKFLLKLSKNSYEYQKYLKWKDNYDVYKFQTLCQLCDKLNGEKPEKRIENAHQFWYLKKNGESYCQKQEFRSYYKNFSPNSIQENPEVEKEIHSIFE